jgi:hypothetical protein
MAVCPNGSVRGCIGGVGGHSPSLSHQMSVSVKRTRPSIGYVRLLPTGLCRLYSLRCPKEMDSLRSDSRYSELRRRIGLTP